MRGINRLEDIKVEVTRENENEVYMTPENQKIKTTPRNEDEYVTNFNKKKWYRDKKKLGIIIGSSVITLILIIVIAVACSKDKKKKPTPDPISSSTVRVSHKLNEVLKYSDTTTQTTSVLFSGVGLETKDSQLKGEYLFNVYEEDNSKNPVEYKAVAALLDLKKVRGKNVENLGGEDVTELTQSNNQLPLIKFKFDENGNISDLEIPSETSFTVGSYIYDFIEKVVNQLTHKNNELNNDDYALLTHTKEQKKFNEYDDSKLLSSVESSYSLNFFCYFVWVNNA